MSPDQRPLRATRRLPPRPIQVPGLQVGSRRGGSGDCPNPGGVEPGMCGGCPPHRRSSSFPKCGQGLPSQKDMRPGH